MYELCNTGPSAYWLLGVLSVHPNVTQNMLLLQHCYVIILAAYFSLGVDYETFQGHEVA